MVGEKSWNKNRKQQQTGFSFDIAWEQINALTADRNLTGTSLPAKN